MFAKMVFRSGRLPVGMGPIVIIAHLRELQAMFIIAAHVTSGIPANFDPVRGP